MKELVKQLLIMAFGLLLMVALLSCNKDDHAYNNVTNEDLGPAEQGTYTTTDKTLPTTENETEDDSNESSSDNDTPDNDPE